MRSIKINSKKLEKEKIKQIIDLLKEGKVIIFPTDTVYIPIADATNKKAVRKVFLIKKRAIKNPIPIFVKDIKTAKELAKIDKKQEKFLKSVWFTRPNFSSNSQKQKKVKIAPKIWVGKGKVTIVLKRKKTKTRLYGVAKDTIALRIPNFKPVNFLLEKLNRPLVGTSANISGQPPSGSIKAVVLQFKGKKHQPDLIVDAGNLKPGKPSTVLNLAISPPKILRL